MGRIIVRQADITTLAVDAIVSDAALYRKLCPDCEAP